MDHLSGIDMEAWLEEGDSAFEAMQQMANAGVDYMVNMIMAMENGAVENAPAGNGSRQANNEAWESEITDKVHKGFKSEADTVATEVEACENDTETARDINCETGAETAEDTEYETGTEMDKGTECEMEPEADRQRIHEAAGEAAERTAAKEALNRAEHEAAEAKRKEEWEARQQTKKAAEQEQLKRLESMSDQEVMEESLKRISADTERVTRRNLKECLSEHIQTKCLEDSDFARLTMHPKKSMLHCFWYVNRKAEAFIKREMEELFGETQSGMYGSDVPDDLCYQWAEDYFYDADAREDKEDEKEDRFIAKPYNGKTASKPKEKKKAEKKQPEKKPGGKSTDKKPDTEQAQLSFIDQLVIPGLEQEVKAE